MPGAWVDPDSEGLSDQQVSFLETTLACAEGAAVFCHAPLLASHAGAVPALVSQLDAERFDSDLEFERWLANSRLRCGVLFRNPRAIVRQLRSTRAPVTWFAGHVHRRGGFYLDKASGAIGELAQSIANGGDHVDFIQVPALGLHGSRPQDDSEYLLAVLRQGRLIRHRYCNVRRGDSEGLCLG